MGAEEKGNDLQLRQENRNKYLFIAYLGVISCRCYKVRLETSRPSFEHFQSLMTFWGYCGLFIMPAKAPKKGPGGVKVDETVSHKVLATSPVFHTIHSCLDIQTLLWSVYRFEGNDSLNIIYSLYEWPLRTFLVRV